MREAIFIEEYYGQKLYFYPQEDLFKAWDGANTVTFSNKSYQQLRKNVKSTYKFKYTNVTVVDEVGKTMTFGCMETDGYLYDDKGRKIWQLHNVFIDCPQVKNLFAELELNKQRQKEIWNELHTKYKFKLC